MWSLGCIVVELFLGLPIFPGTSEYNQLSRIIDTLGNPPNWMIEKGKNSGQFMEKYVDQIGNKHYKLKSREKFSAEFKVDEKPSKQYFPSTKLDQIIMNYPLPRPNMKPAEVEAEMHSRASLLNFVQGLLNMNPFERWTPHQAAMHPFITRANTPGRLSHQWRQSSFSNNSLSSNNRLFSSINHTSSLSSNRLRINGLAPTGTSHQTRNSSKITRNRNNSSSNRNRNSSSSNRNSNNSKSILSRQSFKSLLSLLSQCRPTTWIKTRSATCIMAIQSRKCRLNLLLVMLYVLMVKCERRGGGESREVVWSIGV